MKFPSTLSDARRVVVILVALLSAALGHGAAGATEASRHSLHNASGSSSSYFYTTYEVSGSDLSWVTCGYDSASSGCYGSGNLGPFGRICSVAGSSGRVVVADSDPAGGVTTLYFYKQEESSTPSATLEKTLRLPDFPASGTAQCHLSVLGSFVYFGTNESATFDKVNTRTYQISSSSTCGGVTSAITANNNAVVVSQSGCFESFDKQGDGQEEGGEFTDIFVPGANGFAPTP